ncbi:hypothetical protein EsDP_00000672 [Epichloe bromicola]|uniref:Pkr1-like protein n=1 Tax=Epichloe bromicola TaxID=79588 RepID=A0ABQ0CFM4_9HYPO
MSSFMIDLWESIFTPGPTPTILIATNVSFGALQIVLFSLLLATSSIHFAVLSVLCAGLWWAINWFARELAIAQAAAAEQDLRNRPLEGEARGAASADDGSDDTEVETTGREEARNVRHRPVRRHDDGTAALKGSLSQSSVSTEDEWEKVSGSEKESTNKGQAGVGGMTGEMQI